MKNMLQIFYCESCDYECSKKFCWTQHLSTSKHNKAKTELMKANEKYECEKCKKLLNINLAILDTKRNALR